MVVEDVVVVVVEDVAALGGSDVSGSSIGTEAVADVVVEVVVDVVVLVVVFDSAVVTSGSDVSSALDSGGKPCASTTVPAGVAVVAMSGDVVIEGIPAVAETLAGATAVAPESSPPDEHAKAVSVKAVVIVVASKNFRFIAEKL